MKENEQNTGKMTQIVQHEKVTLRSKIRDIIRTLLKKPIFKFSELFSPKTRSRLEIVTGFLAILELAKLKKITLIQPKRLRILLSANAKIPILRILTMKMWQRKTDSSGVIQMDLKKLEGIFEGMLFASGDKVSIEKLSSITGIDKRQ